MSDESLDEEFQTMQSEAEQEDAINKRREVRRDEHPELSVEQLSDILGLTIKADNTNKVLTFFCYLSAYTDESQFNISFNAPSSAGKSYIALEVASLFPKSDVIKVGYCSPTAFFHDTGVLDGERKCLVLDFERKILVLLDQPHPDLLHRLRPLLSHDEKEIWVKITDRKEKYGLKTKNAVLRGFPAVIFCTAGLKMDEQEATRFILLSPEVTQDKIRQGIGEAVSKESDPDAYSQRLHEDSKRKMLMRRIEAIKDERIRTVVIPSPTEVERRFVRGRGMLKPRHLRDVKRLFALIRTHALLNLWHRQTTSDPRVIVASQDDIEAAFRIYNEIALSQELSLPPYIYQLYRELICPLYVQHPEGLARKDIIHAHFERYGRPLPRHILDKEVIPMLEMAGLVTQETDPNNARRKLISPVMPPDEPQEQSPKDSGNSAVG